MEYAVGCLETAHPTRALYFILACGLKWMIFRWEPMDTGNAPLFMLAEDGSTWELDERIRGPVEFHHRASSSQPPSPYIKKASSGQLNIDTRFADSLNFWSLDENNILVHKTSMIFLEDYFSRMRNEVFSGANPPDFY